MAYTGLKPRSDSQVTLWAGARIEVVDADVRDVVLQLSEGATVRGRVAIDEPGIDRPLGGIEVRAFPMAFALQGPRPSSVETDDDGVLSLNEGAPFGAPEIGTVDDIPAPGPGQTMIAAVLFYEGQSELSNDHIIVPMPLGVVPKDPGLQIDEAAADTPLEADKFGFWDVVDEVLKSIIKLKLKAIVGAAKSRRDIYTLHRREHPRGPGVEGNLTPSSGKAGHYARCSMARMSGIAMFAP